MIRGDWIKPGAVVIDVGTNRVELPDGKTKMEEWEVPLRAQGRGTELSTTMTVKSLQFRRTNQNYNLDWHPAPERQFVITLSGSSEVEVSGGVHVAAGAGHINLIEDTTGKGHLSKAIDGKIRNCIFVPIE